MATRSMTVHESATWSLLQAHHVGRANVIQQAELAEQVGVTQRTVQQITKALRDELGLPVCASSRTVKLRIRGRTVTVGPGVYIPASIREAEESVQNMLSRGWETVSSGRHLASVVRRYLGSQPQLPLSDLDRPCTGILRAGEQGFCGWCGDVFTASVDGQEFCQVKKPLCRDLFWAEARRVGARELRRRMAS